MQASPEVLAALAQEQREEAMPALQGKHNECLRLARIASFATRSKFGAIVSPEEARVLQCMRSNRNEANREMAQGFGSGERKSPGWSGSDIAGAAAARGMFQVRLLCCVGRWCACPV